jgi:hypothetical protein
MSRAIERKRKWWLSHRKGLPDENWSIDTYIMKRPCMWQLPLKQGYHIHPIQNEHSMFEIYFSTSFDR